MAPRLAKSMKELGKALNLSKAEAAKVEMRTGLVLAIKRIVEKKNLTHAEAAKRAGVGRTVVTAILNGNTTRVSTEYLIDVAQSLGLTVTLRIE